MKRLRLLALLLLLPAGLLAQAVPPLVNYQGRLSKPDGSPLPTGDYQLSFSVFDASTGGSRIWGPQVFNGNAGLGFGPAIPVVQGYFNVMLGPSDVNGASLSAAFNGTNRFVEVTVSNHAPIAPRQQILAAPFAFQAAHATTAGLASNVVSGINITNAVIANSSFAGLSGASVAAGLPLYVNSAGQLGSQTSRQVSTNVGLGGLAVSLSTGDFEFTGGASQNPYPDVAVTNLTVTIATTGLRPVMVLLVPDPTVDLFPQGSHIGVPGSDNYNEVYVTLNRGSTRIGRIFAGTDVTGARTVLPPGAFSFIDLTPPAGTNTYSISAAGVFGDVVEFYYVRMAAYEQ